MPEVALPETAVPETALPDPMAQAAFAGASRQLYGAIRQEFAAPDGFAALSHSALGQCQLSRIRASAHRVIADPAARRLSDADSVKILVAERGSAVFRQAGAEIGLAAGAVARGVVYDPVRAYGLDNPGPVDQIILQVPRAGLTDAALRRLGRPLALGGEARSAALAAFIQAAAGAAPGLEPARGQDLALWLTGLLQDLLMAGGTPAAPEGAGPLDLLRLRIKAHIRRHLADPALSPQGIARAMGCSARYLHRAFEAEGMTLQRHIWDQRLAMSLRLLTAAAPRSVSEVGFACGFNSSAHFARAFRARYGLSPREARAGLAER